MFVWNQKSKVFLGVVLTRDLMQRMHLLVSHKLHICDGKNTFWNKLVKGLQGTRRLKIIGSYTYISNVILTGDTTCKSDNENLIKQVW